MIHRGLYGVGPALTSVAAMGLVITSLHLLNVEIERFRSIEGQWISAEGLVVLFGLVS